MLASNIAELGRRGYARSALSGADATGAVEGDRGVTPIYIYALFDAEGRPRYVGQSYDPHGRYREHVSERARPAVKEWVDSLIRNYDIPANLWEAS